MISVIFRKLAIAATLSGFFFSSNVFSATTADVVFVVDESGSMAGEHAWLQDVVTSLDAQLKLAAVTNNRFAIIGFGGGTGHLEGHTHQDFSDALTTSTAFGTLLTNGGTEDGYSGIDAAFKLSFRSDAAANIILVTDEDRDTIAAGTGLNFANILDQFKAKNALLNAVVDSNFRNGTRTALGVDAKGNAYSADGSGGFTKVAGGTIVNSSAKEDYIDLAIATQGAGWDLAQLRAGGLTADSFTKAFIDTKVKEIIITNPVPLPAAFPLLASGLAGLGFFNRKRKKAA